MSEDRGGYITQADADLPEPEVKQLRCKYCMAVFPVVRVIVNNLPMLLVGITPIRGTFELRCQCGHWRRFCAVR